MKQAKAVEKKVEQKVEDVTTSQYEIGNNYIYNPPYIHSISKECKEETKFDSKNMILEGKYNIQNCNIFD